MIAECKKIVTDINRKDKNIDDINKYLSMLSDSYNMYAMVKMCMNYYTMKEMLAEREEKGDVEKLFDKVSCLIDRHIVKGERVTKESLEQIEAVRDKIEYKMHNLTAYADGFELYEYILNRIEAGIKNTIESVDIDTLSAEMFKYVFSENDTVVINSKLQLLMAQLPVRMTKNKFYDVLTNTLTIYKGSEKSSVEEFVDMLETAVLIKKPEGFETEYEELCSVYRALQSADYRNMSEEIFDELLGRLQKAAFFVNEEVSSYMLLQEIVNDVFAILITCDSSYENNITHPGYKAATEILEACSAVEDMNELPEQLLSKFMSLEGAQENTYECVMILESALDDVRSRGKNDKMTAEAQDIIKKLLRVEKLLASSLFVSLSDKEEKEIEIADNDFIMKKRDELTEKFAEVFKTGDRNINRSIMSKVLASMPIFLNSQQEIKDYFDYVLLNCKDDSELTACSRLVREIMEE